MNTLVLLGYIGRMNCLIRSQCRSYVLLKRGGGKSVKPGAVKNIDSIEGKWSSSYCPVNELARSHKDLWNRSLPVSVDVTGLLISAPPFTLCHSGFVREFSSGSRVNESLSITVVLPEPCDRGDQNQENGGGQLEPIGLRFRLCDFLEPVGNAKGQVEDEEEQRTHEEVHDKHDRILFLQ